MVQGLVCPHRPDTFPLNKHMKTFPQFISEAATKVRLYKDPTGGNDNLGADVSQSPRSNDRAVKSISTKKLSGFEPDSKMDSPESKGKLKGIKSAIKRGDKMPPILVRKHPSGEGYQVVDGHHRFHAHKQLGIKAIPARVVSDRNVEET